mgnify:FL=1
MFWTVLLLFPLLFFFPFLSFLIFVVSLLLLVFLLVGVTPGVCHRCFLIWESSFFMFVFLVFVFVFLDGGGIRVSILLG